MPDATAAEIKQALLDDVDPVPAFAGKSVTGGRLSIERLARLAAESVRYAFTSMTAPAGVVVPPIGVTGPTAGGEYAVVLGLGMEDAGEIWALADKDVTLDGVTVTTDDAGDAMFPLGTFAGLRRDGPVPADGAGRRPLRADRAALPATAAPSAGPTRPPCWSAPPYPRRAPPGSTTPRRVGARWQRPGRHDPGWSAARWFRSRWDDAAGHRRGAGPPRRVDAAARCQPEQPGHPAGHRPRDPRNRPRHVTGPRLRRLGPEREHACTARGHDARRTGQRDDARLRPGAGPLDPGPLDPRSVHAGPVDPEPPSGPGAGHHDLPPGRCLGVA